jgi:aminoglycoside phosphotransferase (APT) family kinase protein
MNAAIANSPAEGGQDDGLAIRLQKYIQNERGADNRVTNLAAMEDGHAGLTFGFNTIDLAGRPLESYVLKLAPAGVTRRGNTDVYRQAPLLRALKRAGLPVPAVLGLAGRRRTGHAFHHHGASARPYLFGVGASPLISA